MKLIGEKAEKRGMCEWRKVRSGKWVVLGLVNAYEETSDYGVGTAGGWPVGPGTKAGVREVISRGVTPCPLIIVAAGSRRTTRRPASIPSTTRKSAVASSASLLSPRREASLSLSLHLSIYFSLSLSRFRVSLHCRRKARREEFAKLSRRKT